MPALDRLPILAAICLSLAACGEGATPGAASGCVPAALPVATGAPVACAPFDTASRAELLSLVNEVRASARSCGTDAFAVAPPLEWDPCLERAAAGHSKDMSTVNFFSHTGSDGSRIGMRATSAGFRWNTVGENIAAGQPTGAVAMAGWVDSPGHCRNLMNPRYERLGMACSDDPGSEYGSYWAQVFGRRQ